MPAPAKKTKKVSALQKLQNAFNQKKAKPDEKVPPPSSLNPFAVSDLVKDTAKPNLKGFAHEFDNKELQEGILGNDYLTGVTLLDDDGNFSTEELNKVIQKAVYSAVASSQESMQALVGDYDAHSIESMQSHLNSYAEAQVLSATEFSEDDVMQSHAILYREQIRAKYPDATPDDVNDAVREYVQSIEDKSEAKKADTDAPQQIEETDYAKEFGTDHTHVPDDKVEKGGDDLPEDLEV